MKKSGRFVPTAGIYRSLPHNMYYESTDKWAFAVSAVQMTVFMSLKHDTHTHTQGKTWWRKTQSITSQQAQNTFKTHKAEWIKTPRSCLGELAGNTLAVGLFPARPAAPPFFMICRLSGTIPCSFELNSRWLLVFAELGFVWRERVTHLSGKSRPLLDFSSHRA